MMLVWIRSKRFLRVSVLALGLCPAFGLEASGLPAKLKLAAPATRSVLAPAAHPVLAPAKKPAKPKLTKIAPKPAEAALRNWGLDNSEASSHIEAKRAWKITEGSSKVIVAVIDTGIDAAHPDLKDNLWKKPGSINEYGFDFVFNKKNPEDTNGHGTHIAGIIGATAKVGTGP